MDKSADPVRNAFERVAYEVAQAVMVQALTMNCLTCKEPAGNWCVGRLPFHATRLRRAARRVVVEYYPLG